MKRFNNKLLITVGAQKRTQTEGDGNLLTAQCKATKNS